VEELLEHPKIDPASKHKIAIRRDMFFPHPVEFAVNFGSLANLFSKINGESHPHSSALLLRAGTFGGSGATRSGYWGIRKYGSESTGSRFTEVRFQSLD
jgi:hypothetical protein